MMRRFKQLFLYILLVTALLSVFYLCLFIGSVRIASTDVRAILRCLFAGGTPPDKNLYNLLVYVRMPRLVLNMLAGAVLSMAGILMQTLTHNPLAEPYVLGVSSGASTGAAGAIVFHWFSFLQGGRVFFSAFVCSFLAIAIVLALQGRSTSSVRLVLTGIVGFVGLIIPHIMRKAAGAGHRHLILSASLAGALFLVLADTFARTAFTPQELPIGVMTAFIGAPVFLFIIHRVYHENNS